MAEHRANSYISGLPGVEGEADVQIAGVPFLNQVLRRKFDNVRVHLVEINRFGIRLTDISVRLEGAHPDLIDGLSGQFQEILVDRVSGRATLTYADLQTAISGATIGIDVVRVTGSPTGLKISVPGLSAFFGSVKLAARIEDGKVQLTVESPLVPPVLAEAIENVALTLPTLPYGLSLTNLRFGESGMVLSVHGVAAVLPAQ